MFVYLISADLPFPYDPTCSFSLSFCHSLSSWCFSFWFSSVSLRLFLWLDESTDHGPSQRPHPPPGRILGIFRHVIFPVLWGRASGHLKLHFPQCTTKREEKTGFQSQENQTERAGRGGGWGRHGWAGLRLGQSCLCQKHLPHPHGREDYTLDQVRTKALLSSSILSSSFIPPSPLPSFPPHFLPKVHLESTAENEGSEMHSYRWSESRNNLYLSGTVININISITRNGTTQL